MPLSWNEIRDRAITFSKEWADESSEDAEAKSFWDAFFNVFGINRRRLASFEEPVKRRADGGKTSTGYIDLFWKGQLIVEHKSRGKNLDKAYAQALDYFPGIPERDLPHYVLVSDFAHLRLYDLDDDRHWDVALKDLHKHVRRFGFIAGYQPQEIKEQDPVNVKAAEQMGRLHDQLKASGYAGHQLEVYLVRLLFCLFADDTTLFDPKGAFRDYVEGNTKEDGSDLGYHLSMLFEVLNTPEDKRQKALDERLRQFPYVNGRLFEERLSPAAFDSKMRETLLDCCGLDWSKISPAIFGALFQSVMDEKLRRNLGAHYTSERNILRLIKPLFLDDLRAEFERAKRSTRQLFELHKKIALLKFLDPACGCGNFLVIAYRELRTLELDVLRAARDSGQQHLDIFHLVQVNVDQFYGIEIEEFPAQIAQVAMWLTDHQMNMVVSEEFGHYYRRLPLTRAATIRNANALRIDWNDVVPAEQLDYILGNPPFVGKQYQTPEQKANLDAVCAGVKGAGVLDLVTGWYLKAVHFIRGDGQGPDLLSAIPGALLPPRDRVKVAFVSTNSITQGEQVSILWPELLRLGVKIHFAHRTFQWSNEARGVAAVHCVIVGFALFDTERKTIFEYPDIKADGHPLQARNINPYLVDAPDVVLDSRRVPICMVPEIVFGSMPNDGGYLLLEDTEKEELLKLEPAARKWVRPFLGAEEFINGKSRWCLWLVGITPQELRALPGVSKRVAGVKRHREESKRETTKELAKFPALFGEIRQPSTPYMMIPSVSSERRDYIPVGLQEASVIASNLCLVVPNATRYHLGVISSAMHMAWVRNIAGRLESRYRYSNQIVYNNFPWPSNPSGKQIAAIEERAQAVLDARALYSDSSLADLYDPTAMPPELRKAHTELDKAVDTAYGRKSFNSDAERVAFLFELYQKYTSLLPNEAKPRRRRKAK